MIRLTDCSNGIESPKCDAVPTVFYTTQLCVKISVRKAGVWYCLCDFLQVIERLIRIKCKFNIWCFSWIYIHPQKIGKSVQNHPFACSAWIIQLLSYLCNFFDWQLVGFIRRVNRKTLIAHTCHVQQCNLNQAPFFLSIYMTKNSIWLLTSVWQL